MEEPVLIGQKVQVSDRSSQHIDDPCKYSANTPQFMYRSSTIAEPTPTPARITFSALARTESDDEAGMGKPSTVDGFLGMSEGGFILGKKLTSVCNVSGAIASVGTTESS
jgi:hypothetical protein